MYTNAVWSFADMTDALIFPRRYSQATMQSNNDANDATFLDRAPLQELLKVCSRNSLWVQPEAPAE